MCRLENDIVYMTKMLVLVAIWPIRWNPVYLE